MKSPISSNKPKPQNNKTLLKRILFFLPLLKFVVQEESMQPFLSPGDMVIINRLARIKKNDVIVFKNPQKNKETYLIKSITKINGRQVYVEGINKEKSIDSRHFGWIDRKDVIGKMILKF